MADRPRKKDRVHLYALPTYRSLLERLGANLRELRATRGITQQRAAEECEVALHQYVQLENAQRNLTFLTFARIARGFGVDPHDLLAGGTAKHTGAPTSRTRRVRKPVTPKR